MNLYWIHHADHTDIFSQGYVGVSNNVKKRWSDHAWKAQNAHLANAINKYGWDNLVKEIVLIADDGYCLDIESKLRPTTNIGWNITFGGGMPPKNISYKSKSEETKKKISKTKTGVKRTAETKEKIVPILVENGKKTRFGKGCVPWNKGLKWNRKINRQGESNV